MIYYINAVISDLYVVVFDLQRKKHLKKPHNPSGFKVHIFKTRILYRKPEYWHIRTQILRAVYGEKRITVHAWLYFDFEF